MNKNTIIKNIKENGFYILEKILSESECNHYKKLSEKLYKKYSPLYPRSEASDKFHEDSVKMVYNLQNKHYDFWHLINNELTMPIIKKLLQEGSYQESEPIILQVSAARSPVKKFAKQQLHIDSNLPGTPFPLAIQTLWALDDFTEKNGATRIVPGSHKLAQFAENNKTYPDEKIVTMPKGSVLIYNGSLWHGSSEKKDDGDRWAIINTYFRWFARPSFDFNKCTPKKIYNKLNHFEKDLLGLRFNPPKDEFERLSRKSEDFPKNIDYKLPI